MAHSKPNSNPARTGNSGAPHALRILIISHYFPPQNAIASHRPHSWARQWMAAGHRVEVLTTTKHSFDGPMDLDLDLRGIPVHVAPFLAASGGAAAASPKPAAAGRWERLKVATRRIRLGLGVFAEIQNLSLPALLRTGRGLLRSGRFDAIVSTSPPEVTHFAARRLAREFGVPWVADFRDLWYSDMRVGQFEWASSAMTGIARRMLRDAALVVTVSQGLAERLRSAIAAPVAVCYNGFVNTGRSPLPRPEWKDPGRFHLVYTGKLFPKKRDPEVVFRALVALRGSDPGLGRRLQVHFFGHEDPWLGALVRRHGVEDCVALHGFVPYIDSLAAQAHADGLLFVDWMDSTAEGILTGKLFEYLRSGRPILCVGSRTDTEAANLIRECGAGIVVAGVDEIREVLEAALRGGIPFEPRPGAVARFDRASQAAALLEEIQAMLARRERKAARAGGS